MIRPAERGIVQPVARALAGELEAVYFDAAGRPKDLATLPLLRALARWEEES